MKKNIVLITIMGLIFASCTTLNSVILPNEGLGEQIQRNYDENPLYSYFLFQSLSPEEREDFPLDKSAYLDRFREEIQQSLASEDYLSQFRYIQSLENLKEEIDSEEASTAGNYIIELLDQNNTVGAESYLLLHSDLFHSMGSELKETIYSILEERDRFSTLNTLDPERFSLNTESNSDWIKGCVTVVVDRGISMEGGIGRSDMLVGSGFFIDSQGYLMTNYHVISSQVDPEYDGYSRLYVRLYGAKTENIPARVIGWDKALDLAVLKVEIEPEYVFSFSSQNQSVVGDRVFAIGSPGGLESTLTSGIISAVDRRFLALGTAFQIDAAVNPGNSGGPLINEYGQVIGIVFAGIEQFEGVNFAISTDWILPLLISMTSGGAVEHNWMGISLVGGEGRELEVIYVFPDSSAEKAGLIPGDILLSFNDQPCTSIQQLQFLEMVSSPNSLSRLEWKTIQGDLKSSVVYLSQRPQLPLEEVLDREARNNLFIPLFGMDLTMIKKNIFEEIYSVDRVYQGMTAYEAGISENDTISLRKWNYDDENEAVIIQMIIKQRKSGYWESGLQLGTFLDANNLI